MRLRRPSVGDLPTLNRILKESRAYQGQYAPMLEGYAISADQLARDHFELAEDDQGVIGFFSLTPGEPVELDLMFVADARQGQGLGGQLFQAAVGAARGMGGVRMLIVSNPPAESFYLRQGARRVGEAPPGGRVTWARPILHLDLN